MTIRLKGGLELKRKRQQSIYFSPLRVYVDRWRPQAQDSDGKPLRVKDPPPVQRSILTIEQLLAARSRHNSLQTALTGTDRILLRWGESGGNGLPNPEAEVRETHYDPLPPDLQEKVDGIVIGSPWELLTRKWYRTNLPVKDLAAVLRVSRPQLYIDWKSSLWYYRGRFEADQLRE